MNNEAIINSIRKKVDLTVGNLQSNGGYLPEEASAQFMEIAIEESVVLQELRFEDMSAETKKVSAMHFTEQITRGATAHQALGASDRVSPTLDQANLKAEEVIAECFIGDDELDNNIEQERFEETVKGRLGGAFGRDIEKAVLQGDTTSANSLLAIWDGMIKKATTNIANFGGSVMTDDLMTDLFQALPKESRKPRQALRCYVGSDAHLNYLNRISARQDERGSKVHLEGGEIMFLGFQLVDVDLIPEDMGGSNNETIALVTNPNNAVWGMQRKMRVEAERSARARGTYWVLTAKPAFDYVYEPHVAKGINILAT